MADVIKFGPKLAVKNDKPPSAGDVSPELVEQLEELLKEAKEGKLIAAAFVLIDNEHTLGNCWIDFKGCAHQLLAGSMYLTNRMLKASEKDYE